MLQRYGQVQRTSMTSLSGETKKNILTPTKTIALRFKLNGCSLIMTMPEMNVILKTTRALVKPTCVNRCVGRVNFTRLATDTSRNQEYNQWYQVRSNQIQKHEGLISEPTRSNYFFHLACVSAGGPNNYYLQVSCTNLVWVVSIRHQVFNPLLFTSLAHI